MTTTAVIEKGPILKVIVGGSTPLMARIIYLEWLHPVFQYPEPPLA